jgi:hypothetical protein
MRRSDRKTIFWAAYLPLSLPAGSGFESRPAPSAPPMAHGPHHGTSPVGDPVGDGVGHAVGRKSLPECSLWAAGARPIRIPAGAAALLLRKAATGLRALGLKPASLLRTALVQPSCSRRPAGQGQNQHPRGGRRRKLGCERSPKSFPKTPACASAPDWRPFRSVSLAQNKSASRARYARREAPHRSRLGALPPLSLVGTRDCFCRDRLSQRWGASFSLLRLGAPHLGSPAWGPAQTFPLTRESFLPFPPVARATCAHLCAGERANVLAGASAWLRALALSKLKVHQPWINLDPNIPQSSTKCTTKPE